MRVGKEVLTEKEITVYIEYTQRLQEATVIDHSTRYGLYSLMIKEEELIQVCEIAIKGISVGNKRELNSPPDLCY